MLPTANRRLEASLVALGCALVPGWIYGPALGRFKAPGIEGELLYSSLIGAWQPWDAVSPLGSLVLRLLTELSDPGLGLGMLGLLGAWLAGLGGYLMGRDKGWKVGALLALSLQLAPPLLRGAWTGEVAPLGVGLAALALAGVAGAPVLAALAAAWCWPLGLVALIGRWRCRTTWLLVLPLLLLQLASPRDSSPWALRQGAPERRTVPAYVTEDAAVLPLPAPPEPPAVQGPSAWDRLGQLHGGLAALIGLLAALALKPRELAVAGLGLLAFLVLGLGLLPLPGAPPPRVEDWLLGLGPPGLGRGATGWGAAVALAGAAGLGALASRHRHAAWPVLALVLVVAARENLRLSVPVTMIPPDPALRALDEQGPASVVVFPASAAPFHQGRAAPARAALALAAAGKVPAEPGVSASWIAPLTLRSGLSVDAGASGLLWEAREPSREGFLLLRRDELPEDRRAPVEGWLAEVAGAPMAESPAWLLYSLE